MSNVEKNLTENLDSTDSVTAACKFTGTHSAQIESASNGQCLFVCIDCKEVIVVYEDSNP